MYVIFQFLLSWIYDFANQMFKSLILTKS